MNNIHKFPYVSLCNILHQGNGVYKCKNQGSHKWTRSGQKLGLNNNALSCTQPNFLSERDFVHGAVLENYSQQESSSVRRVARVFDRVPSCALDTLASKWRRCYPLTRVVGAVVSVILLYSMVLHVCRSRCTI